MLAQCWRSVIDGGPALGQHREHVQRGEGVVLFPFLIKAFNYYATFRKNKFHSDFLFKASTATVYPGVRGGSRKYSDRAPAYSYIITFNMLYDLCSRS